MKRFVLFMGLTAIAVTTLPAQISRSDSFDVTAFKATESAENVTLIENGRQIYPKTSKSLSKSRAQEPAPMVVKGRTWWYHSYITGTNAQQEFGFRIGSPTEIDGQEWYSVEQIRYSSSTEKDQYFSDNATNICYIRQEGNRIFSRITHYLVQTHPLCTLFLGPCYKCMGGTYVLEFSVSGNEGDEFLYTSSATENDNPEYLKYKVGESEIITNSGIEYKRYSLQLIDSESDISYIQPDIIYSIPELGYTTSKESLSELFFAPMGVNLALSYPYQMSPRLRYVTDEDNNILYEALGGLKLWEYDPAGVAEIATDGSDEPESWYTIDGRAIQTPTSAGIYIRRTSTTSQKVIIK